MNGGIRHFGITVFNLDNALKFYCEGLGFHLDGRFGRPQEYTEAVTGVAGTVLAAAIISRGDFKVELLEYSDREDRPVQAAAVQNPGVAHICLEVDSISGLMDSLRLIGARFQPSVTTIPPGPGEGNQVVYGWDPDGIAFELVQVTAKEEIE